MDATFRYDFNSPYAYLAAGRIDEVLGDRVRWQPVAFGFMFMAQGRVPWSLGDGREAGIAECERRAAARGLPAIRWPEGWPRESYTLDPLRAALVAEREGVLREYTQAAFRRNFVEGTGLGDGGALDVAEEVGLDREEAAAAMRGWAKDDLREATDEAIAAGVPGVPTVTVGDEHFWGDDRLEEAAAALL